MRLEFDVTYMDGSVQHVKVRPKHFIAVEDMGIQIGENLKSSFQIAHLASERSEPFDEWLDLVDDIETISGEAVNGSESGQRPTQEESPTSP